MLALKPCYTEKEAETIRERQTNLMNHALKILIPSFDYARSCEKQKTREKANNLTMPTILSKTFSTTSITTFSTSTSPKTSSTTSTTTFSSTSTLPKKGKRRNINISLLVKKYFSSKIRIVLKK